MNVWTVDIRLSDEEGIWNSYNILANGFDEAVAKARKCIERDFTKKKMRDKVCIVNVKEGEEIDDI